MAALSDRGGAGRTFSGSARQARRNEHSKNKRHMFGTYDHLHVVSSLSRDHLQVCRDIDEDRERADLARDLPMHKRCQRREPGPGEAAVCMLAVAPARADRKAC
eukprot:4699902-Pleurochrysis_carterae.AAC.2